MSLLTRKHWAYYSLAMLAVSAAAGSAVAQGSYPARKVSSNSSYSTDSSDPAPAMPTRHTQPPRSGSRAFDPWGDETVLLDQTADPQEPRTLEVPSQAHPARLGSAEYVAQRATATTPSQLPSRWSPARPYRAAASRRISAEQIPAPAAGGRVYMEGDVIPEGADYMEGPMGPDDMYEHGGDCCGGDECGSCCENSCGPGYCDPWWGCGMNWRENFTVFSGVQAFEGPVDFGFNRNFGIHEGINWGSPFWHHYGIGFQLGGRGVQSNFASDEREGEDFGGRNQSFVTMGLFHRASCGRGLQWGVVGDWFHDDYYIETDLNQMRGEISYLTGSNREFGFMFASGSDSAVDEFEEIETRFEREPIDMYAIFYRQSFCGGDARAWLGVTDNSDGLIGGQLNLPLTNCWSLSTNVNYLIPEEDTALQESWAMGLSFVWHPCCNVRANCSPYRPLFDVADNSSFMVRMDSGLLDNVQPGFAP